MGQLGEPLQGTVVTDISCSPSTTYAIEYSNPLYCSLDIAVRRTEHRQVFIQLSLCLTSISIKLKAMVMSS